MKLSNFKWLADENINSRVVDFLRQSGLDVEQVADLGMQGEKDLVVLKYALSTGRIVLTHDSDFGTLAIQSGESFVGIVYLRPGHIDSAFTIESIRSVLVADLDVKPPFIIVARRSTNQISIRLRQLGTDTDE